MRRFRHLRRLTAIVANLLLLQLAYATGASACPMGEAMHAPGASAAGAVHSPHHAASGAASISGSSAGPASHQHAGGTCDMACAPSSCAAAGHCTTSVTIGNGVTPAAFATAAAPALALEARWPHSVSPAPEPPPPRV